MLKFDKLQKTFIIAEIGSNHNQSMTLAKEMIVAAKEAGADAVKFQSINVNELYYNPSQKIKELHKKIDFAETWYSELKEFCDTKNIIFHSSPTYLKAVEILKQLNVLLYKLASAQVGTFPQLVEAVAKLRKPTLLSTGIVSYSELEQVVQLFYKHHHDNFAILHCNSLYPTPYKKANLHLIEVYKQMFGKTVGYSDHTEGIYVSLAAVSLGAKIIERHFTTDKTLPVPDAAISITPSEFRQMVEGIRAIEHALISKSRIELEIDEKNFKKNILYRLVLKRDKAKGEHLTADDFEFKRHYEGIDCREMHIVINHMCPIRPLSKGELLRWDALKGKEL